MIRMETSFSRCQLWFEYVVHCHQEHQLVKAKDFLVGASCRENTKKGSWKWSSAADESAQICTEGTPKTMQILTQLLIRMWMFDPSWSYDYSLRAQSEPLASNQQPTTVTTAIITTEGQYLPSHSIIREGRWKRERGCALPHLLRFVIKMLSDTAEQHKPATR